jgi:hypothetical protein
VVISSFERPAAAEKAARGGNQVRVGTAKRGLVKALARKAKRRKDILVHQDDDLGRFGRHLIIY